MPLAATRPDPMGSGGAGIVPYRVELTRAVSGFDVELVVNSLADAKFSPSATFLNA